VSGPGDDTLTVDPHTVIWSLAEAERAGKPLLILLHGKGSHEGDLAGLIDRLPAGFAVASLRAPIPDGPGFSWFRVLTPGNPPPESVDAAADAVLAWLDTLPAAPPSLGILGFSQGGVIAVQTLRRAPDRVDFALNLSGFVAAGVEAGDDAIAQHPVFWGRGDADVVIGPAAIERTALWLPAHVDLTAAVYRGLPHSISSEELDDIAAFLEARL
jgi:phospholipase/carboxylesterase